MKIRPVGSELFHAFGRTDIHDEAYSRLSNFSKVPKLLKVKFTPEQATKAQRGSRGIALLFL